MELLDALCCPVSQEPYGPGGPVRPRILPCGHTISHTSLKSILKQDSTLSHTCPICRHYLPTPSASSYPTNFAILDILPRILRLQNGASSTPLPNYSTNLEALHSDSDSDSAARSFPLSSDGSTTALPTPTPSLAAIADLYPQVQWLQERVDLPLRLLDILAVAQGLDNTLRSRTAGQLVVKYQLPENAIHPAQSGSSPLHQSASVEGAIQRGLVAGAAEGAPPVVIIATPCTLANAAHAVPPQLPPPPEVAVAPYAALQLLPDVWPCMQPLVGYRVVAESGSGAAAGAADAAPDGGAAGTLEIAFVQLGESLREYVEQRPPGGPTLPPVEAAEIFTQLVRMIAVLHEHGLTTSATFPLRYSSLFILPATLATRLEVRWAPWEAPGAQGSFLWLADSMCTPPEVAAAGEGEGAVDAQKGDVWRAAAVVVTTLAAPWLSSGDRKPSAWGMLTGLAGKLPSHLEIVLKGCLHEDPQQRWTAARAQLHLALVATQAHTSTGMLASLWSMPVTWSIMLPCPPGRPSAAGRSSVASASNSRRFALSSEAEGGRGIDVVLHGAALQHARTFEFPDPLEEIERDIGPGERHYSVIMCASLVLCVAPLVVLFVVMHMFL